MLLNYIISFTLTPMRVEYITAKSLIRQTTPSIFSWAEVNLNPYNGCFHDCKYCDGKSESYHMHEDFADLLRVKQNAPDLLKRFFKQQGYYATSSKQTTLDTHLGTTSPRRKSQAKFTLFLGGGVCDVYQPLEAELNLTRKLLEIIADYNLPVYILTKNKLVLRDLDLLKQINEVTYASVNFTITLTNSKDQKIFEPRASTTSERFAAVKQLRQAGIHSGIYSYPLLPFIGDSERNISQLYAQVKEADAQFVYCAGLTLKPGRSKQEFLDTIRQHYPSLLSKYSALYGNNNKYGILDYRQAQKFNLPSPEIIGFRYSYEQSIPYASKRYIPPGRNESNLRLAEVLRKVAYLKTYILQDKNFNARNLTKAADILETTSKEALKLSKNEFKMLFIPQDAHEYIIDYFLHSESTFLPQIEEEAYEFVKGLK